MTRMGRPPKPTELKKLAGNPGKRPLPKNEPVPRGKLPRMPADRLPPMAQMAWIRIKVALEPLGILTDADAEAFELLCLHYAHAVRAAELVERQGYDRIDRYGRHYRNPNDTAFLQHSKTFLRFATQFGLTASSRVGLKLPGEEDADQSLADLLFEGTQSDGSGKMRTSPLVRVVGSGPARSLAAVGLGSLELAVTAAKEGMDLTSIKGVGPATIRKLEGIE